MTAMSLPSRGSWRIETNPVGDFCLGYVTALLTASYITGRGKNHSSHVSPILALHENMKQKENNLTTN